MLGRQVTLLLRTPAYTRLSHPTLFPRDHGLTARVLFPRARRSYATPGRPRTAVGEPSRPVKRAVKRAASKADSAAKSPAKQKVEAKKKAASGKKKAVAKARAKPKAKPKPKKELTVEQKAAKTLLAEKKQILALKQAALVPPHVPKPHAYVTFISEKGKEGYSGELKGLSLAEVRVAAATRFTNLAAEWKASTPAVIEHYNHLAQANAEAGRVEYKRWVESHTPEEIQVANRARSALRRKQPAKKNHKSKWTPIHDERAAPRPLSAYLQFSLNRNASGDFKNIHVRERSKLIGQEWKSLSESEKAKYVRLQTEDSDRYASEHNHVYGHLPSTQSAAAAA